MRRHLRGWATGLVCALIASAAGAQMIPGPAIQAPQILKSATSQVAKPKVESSATKLVVVPEAPKLAGPQVTTSEILPAPVTSTSPLLKVPLSSPKVLDTAKVLPTPKATTTSKALAPISASSREVLRQPLLAPDVVHVDVGLNRTTTWTTLKPEQPMEAFADARTRRLDELVRQYRPVLDRDEFGRPVVRGRILLVDPQAAMLSSVLAWGFRVESDRTDPVLRFRTVALAAPAGLGTQAALRELKSVGPQLVADYDHVYEPAGGPLSPSRRKVARSAEVSGPLVGMIDGGVAAHPALAGRVAAQKSFAGPGRATGHGTAIASLLVGNQGVFRGSANGGSLLVADVYGGRRASGSASRIAEALGWLASSGAPVVNISLVGPPNALLKRAVDAARARGIRIVAAVGNDGPAAPPQFPASYPGVIAVTGVDSRGSVLFESGRALHLDFAAPGADMAAARPGQGYVRVRGTSFASALATGRLALVGSPQRLAREAIPGKGSVGRGIVCAGCGIAPGAVGAK